MKEWNAQHRTHTQSEKMKRKKKVKTKTRERGKIRKQVISQNEEVHLSLYRRIEGHKFIVRGGGAGQVAKSSEKRI